MTDDLKIQRLRRKIEARDKRIAGLERQIERLASEHLSISNQLADLPRLIEKAVQRALCNVRMIPVLGIRSDDTIVEVRSSRPERPI